MTINVPQEEAQTAREGYIRRVLVAIDQAANVVLGGNPDETISARSQRAASRGDLIGRAMCWWLDKLQPQHGLKAEAGDLERAQAAQATESKALDQENK